MNPEKPTNINSLVCVYDIENFVQLAKALGSEQELFIFLNEISRITTDAVVKDGGKVIKYIGDSALIIYPEQKVDSAVETLYTLKNQLEYYMAGKGYKNRLSFSLHFGPLVSGYMGKEPFRWFDVIGATVQLAFVLNGKPFKGRFSITPQVFRKLKPETRKLFHKFTPQIFYLAD